MGKRASYTAPLPWLRLYTEFATDPKVQMLSEAMQRRFVMLLCLTGARVVPTADDGAIAFALRLTSEETTETKRVLLAARLIRRDWCPSAWDRRQRIGDHTAAERKRRQRAKASSDSLVSDTGPSRDTSRVSHAAEGEGEGEKIQNRSEGACSTGDAERAVPLGASAPRRFIGILPRKNPRTESSSRRNGDFEQINRDVLIMVRTGGISPDDSEGLAKALHITKAQVVIAVQQLRDRGELARESQTAMAARSN